MSALESGTNWVTRVAIIGSLLLAVGVIAAPEAGAQSVHPCLSANPPPYCAGIGFEPEEGGSGQTGSGGGSAPVDLPPLTYRLTLGTDDDGGSCVNIIPQRVEDPDPPFYTREQIDDMIATIEGGGAWFDPLPDSDIPAAGALNFPLCENEGALVDVAGIAQSVWVGLDIQSPAARIAPGYMLTGLTSYLELDAPTELVATETLPEGLGTLTITATPEHHIDWDDDGATVVTTDTGVPFPGGAGEITHMYTTAGERTVTVTTHWNGTFSGPGFTDQPLGVRVAETTNLPLDVRQWQAIRTAR